MIIATRRTPNATQPQSVLEFDEAAAAPPTAAPPGLIPVVPDGAVVTGTIQSGGLELGRTGGNRLVRRLEVSAATFERLAERDELFANGLEEHALQRSVWTSR